MLTFLVAFLVMLPTLAAALPLAEDNPGGEYDGQATERVEELTELREPASKTYLLEDGSYEAVCYAEDVHYLNDSGKYDEIDNSLIRTETFLDNTTYGIRNAAGAHTVFFSDLSPAAKGEMADAYAVRVESEGYILRFTPLEAAFSGAALLTETVGKDAEQLGSALGEYLRPEDCVWYENAYGDTDLIYQSETHGVKEYLVLNGPDAQTEYSFAIDAGGLAAREVTLTGEYSEEGEWIAYPEPVSQIHFLDEKENTVFCIDRFFAVDGNGAAATKIGCALESMENDTYLLTVSLPKEYLQDPDRSFPVLLDPSVTVSGGSVTYDTYASSRYPSTGYYLNTYLRTGYQSSYFTSRTFIKFDIPSGIDDSITVTGAKLRMEKYSGSVSSLKAYRAIDPWSSSSVTWNNQPNYTTQDASSNAISFTQYSSSNWYSMTVMDIVYQWVHYDYSNHGFCVKEVTESSGSGSGTFYSSDASSPHKPELQIIYLDEPWSTPTPHPTGTPTPTPTATPTPTPDDTITIPLQYAYLLEGMTGTTAANVYSYITLAANVIAGELGNSGYDLNFVITDESPYTAMGIPASCGAAYGEVCSHAVGCCPPGCQCLDNYVCDVCYGSVGSCTLSNCYQYHHKGYTKSLGRITIWETDELLRKIGFVEYRLCASAQGQHENAGGFANVPSLGDLEGKKAIVSILFGNVPITTEHELIHTLGAEDYNCTDGEDCVMRYGAMLSGRLCTHHLQQVWDYLASV